MKHRCLLILGMIAFAWSAAAAELIRTGEYHHADASAQTAGVWLAVMDARVEPAQVSVEPVHDPMLDEDGEKTGWKVASDRAGAQFLVRGAPAVKAGPARTALAFENLRVLEPGQSLSFRIAGKEWRLTCERMKGPTKKESTPPVRLVVAQGRAKRTLIELPQGMNAEQAKGIQWIGDIDGDGAPDVLLDVSTHYAMSELALLLSTGGEQRGPYVIAARLARGGC